MRHKPWLKAYNALGLTDRLLEATKGNAFVMFNTVLGQYELHTVEAYSLSGDSINIALSEEQLSGFLTHDFRANDMAMFADELISQNKIREQDHENHDSKRGAWLRDSLRSIERAMGTKI